MKPLFLRLIKYLLVKFPNDPFLLQFTSCRFTGHTWESWLATGTRKRSKNKVRYYFYKCTKCGKERKHI